MRTRTSLVVAGALLVTLVPGAAGATQPEPVTVAVAVADGTVTVRSDDDLVVVLTLGGWPDDEAPAPADPGEPYASDDVMTVEQNGGMATIDGQVLDDSGGSPPS